MNRRELIALLGRASAASCVSCSVSWPLAAHAQQRAKLPTIAFFSPNTLTAASPWTAAFVRRLGELGWTEGRTVAIEYRWGDGRTDRTSAILAELAQLKPDVIVTHGQGNIIAAKQLIPVIPVVFALATDPIGSGLVASLARPGGNATGLSIQGGDLAGKRLELLREVMPGLRRLGIMCNGQNSEMEETQAAARTLGLDVTTVDVRRAEEIMPAFEVLKGTTDALYVCAEPLINTNRARISIMALGARLSSVHGFREAVEAGSLISYGPNFADLFRRAADYVDKILRGTRPADLPVEQPTKFDLVINLIAAKALGLDVPPTLLARADEVIE